MISKVRTISPILRRVRNPFTAPWSMMRMMWKNPRLLGLPVYLEPVAPSCHWFLILFRNNPDTDDCWILLGIFQIQHSPYEHFESSEWLVSAYSRVILLMEEILHQLIDSLSHLQGFIHPRWLAGCLPSTVGYGSLGWWLLSPLIATRLTLHYLEMKDL